MSTSAGRSTSNGFSTSDPVCRKPLTGLFSRAYQQFVQPYLSLYLPARNRMAHSCTSKTVSGMPFMILAYISRHSCHPFLYVSPQQTAAGMKGPSCITLQDRRPFNLGLHDSSSAYISLFC